MVLHGTLMVHNADIHLISYDIQRTDDDGRQVMAKAHMAFGQVS
jgi:hypothetical protein